MSSVAAYDLPLPDDPPWQELGACRGVDPELFFPRREEWVDGDAAKRVCARCEVRAECLEYALDNVEKFGVWGGTSEKQRRAMRRERNRYPGPLKVTHSVVGSST